MKFAWDTPLVNYLGAKVVNDKGTPVTLGELAIQAFSMPSTLVVDGKTKQQWHAVGLKLSSQKNMREVDLPIEEAAIVKVVVGESPLSQLVVGRIWELLEHPLPDESQ